LPAAFTVVQLALVCYGFPDFSVTEGVIIVTKKIAILHNTVSEQALPDELDVLNQIAAVSESLRELNYEIKTLGFDLDLKSVADELDHFRPDCVFNLVESVNGKGSLVHLAPSLLESMKIPYTGSPVESIFLTSNKLLAKEILFRSGMPTSPWLSATANPKTNLPKSGNYIIKSVWEHASIGLDDSSLVPASELHQLHDVLAKRKKALGGDCFAEWFIDGREFNLSVISSKKGPIVLHPAEILFQGFDSGKPRMVGYSAKWDEDSFEYRNTIRSFEFSESDVALLDKLKNLARQCWHLFRLRGYARVDFRVDPQGNPWILEVNANPCLSKDAGFAAALQKHRISYTDGIRRIIEDV
jgi:D-alanine-D-alanine ligase